MASGSTTSRTLGYYLKLAEYESYAVDINPLLFRSDTHKRGGRYLFVSISDLLRAIDTDTYKTPEKRAKMTIVKVVEVTKTETMTYTKEEEL